MRVFEALNELTRRFSACGIESARTDARLLTAFAMKLSPVSLKMHPETEISEEALKKLQEYAARRENREPVSKILGTRGFWSLDFKVSADVLDPRPDSETIIETVLSLFPDRSSPLEVLDLGTGSGCLALSVLAEYRNASATGVDVSDKALSIAVENAKTNGLSDRFFSVCADWRKDGWTSFFKNQGYDLIISNPPYIAESERESLEPEVLNFDPPEALFGGADGLFAYRRLAPFLPVLLKRGGTGVFEFGKGQENKVKEIFESVGLKFGGFGTDLGGIVRCITVFC